METNTGPVAGIDYPRNLQEFDCWFMSEKACRDYIFRVRWPEAYQCFCCKNKTPPGISSRGYLHGRKCGGEISMTAGTVFEGSRKPLRTGFQAMWLVTSQKHGARALGLQRVLGLSRYQTAWTWLHKLRRAMLRPGRDRLHGSVEVDETDVGGVQRGGKRGRGTENKEIVVIAVAVLSPKGFGRIRIRQVPDVSGDSLVPFLCEGVEPGSEILTEGGNGYNSLTKHNYTHSRTGVSQSGDPAHVTMPAVHRIAALLKRGLLGIHQAAVSGKYLEYYLDEYTFRFNRRTSRARGMLFYRLMQQAVTTTTVTYRQLVDGNHKM